ncbi:MAG: 4Fe-4S dicluster domain-containing protein [Planctomycetes bacterium]|jgi:molybdopterin-containing oxidoreductase family iron-sulfur binding subunit|nr:4Fe-4S dicluster domain-containing protein [Planctomycetota bacterium]
MERREFLKAAAGTAAAAACGVYALRVLTAKGMEGLGGEEPPAGRRWGMLVDLAKCREGCTVCLDACRSENNVAFFGDPRIDIHWIRKVAVRKQVGGRTEEKEVLLLCNHCDEPPCAQVCPVQATYKRHDGIVIVDQHRCIGCRYCMIACPYSARYFNFRDHEDWPNREHARRSHGVAESCNLCAHRLDRGRKPACVEACEALGPAALAVGDLNDPGDPVAKAVATRSVKRLKEDLGTRPKVYYEGL